jgi:hypothetical protein
MNAWTRHARDRGLAAPRLDPVGLGGGVLLVALLVAPTNGVAAPARSAKPRSVTIAPAATPARALSQRLRASGRAEARFERDTPDPLGGARTKLSGRIALELPDRFSLEVPSTGERITATSQGGAWVRPDLKQFVRLGPEQADAVRRAWQMLLGEGGVRTEPLGASRYALTLADSTQEALRVEVTLDSAGLPARVDYDENGQRMTYRIHSWRFVPKRGVGAFTVSAPAGFDTLRMP